MKIEFTRREVLAAAAAWIGAGLETTTSLAQLRQEPLFQLTTFSADVTPPLGHPLMGGGTASVRQIDDPLYANGLVLLGMDKPIVLVAVDWYEIRNDAYDSWRAALAEAARTVPERVLVTSVHQHDAPIADLEAQRILEKRQAAGRICDLKFHERALQNVAHAARASLQNPRRISHIGLGQANVEQAASHGQFREDNARSTFGRVRTTRDPRANARPVGASDPWLKMLSFWDSEFPLAVVSCYAAPKYALREYGKGAVSADFVGMARKRRRAEQPGTAQIYLSGCGASATAEKSDESSSEDRHELADRIYRAMSQAWKATRRHPLKQIAYRTVPLRLEPRNSPGYSVADLQRRLATSTRPFDQCLAALGLSWRNRADAGHKLDVSALDFGMAQVVLLPGGSSAEYQLMAQQLRRDEFVIVAGYGECAPGFIPVGRVWQDGATKLRDWCWVAPSSERALTAALQSVLTPASGTPR
ncbi:MAG TPA: hypothetical protein VK395_28305 [Gemmataceae bacterium]|nr:hypothetical protein [Gemmataceae bacterium]